MYEHDESTWVSSPIDVAEGGLLAIYRGVDSPRVLVGTEPAIVQAAAEQHGLNDGVVDVPPPIESKLGLEEVPWPAARAHMFGRLQVPFGDQPRGVPDDLIDASLRWLRARSAEAEPVILVAGRPVPADWTRAPSILRALLSGIQTIAIAADDPSRPGYSAHWPPTVAFGGAIDWQVAWTEGAQTEHDLVAGMEAMRDHLRASDGLEWAGVTCTDREKWYEDVAIHFPLGLTPPNITTIPDLAIPDAFWWQIIGPGHTSRLHRLPPESRPAGDPNHVEVNFGEAAD